MAYIDRCKLLKDLCKTSTPKPSDTWIVQKCIDVVEQQPSADVVPKSEFKKFAFEIELEFYREFDEIIPSIMSDKISELLKKYTEGRE